MKKVFLIPVLLLMLIPLVSSGETVSVSPGNGLLTKALENCADGDVILLEDGIYADPEESFPLTVNRSITIRAAEGASPVVDAPAMTAAFRIEADDVTLEGIDIRFRRTGIYAVGNDMTLNGCRITLADEAWRVSSCGMWCGGIIHMTMKECAFTGCGVALAGPPLSESSEGLPKLTGLFEVGEDPEYFTSHTIENCTVNGKPLFYASGLVSADAPQDAGEIIICGCGEATVRDADVSDCSMGMVLAYNERITVEHSRADRCGVFGIYAAKCNGGIITDCSAEGTNHAIDIRADRNITLDRCSAVSCEQGMFFSSVTDSVMLNCTVEDTRQGYFMAAGCGNTMTGCLATGCENGVHLENEADVLMISCMVEKCTVCGVRLDRTSLAMVHNTLQNNWTALIAYGNTRAEIADNLFTGNENCSMFLRNTGFCRIIGNRIENSGQYSAIAAGTVNDSIWEANTTDVPSDFSEATGGFAITEP